MEPMAELISPKMAAMSFVWAGFLALVVLGFDAFVIQADKLPYQVLDFDLAYVFLATIFFIWLLLQRFRPGIKGIFDWAKLLCGPFFDYLRLRPLFTSNANFTRRTAFSKNLELSS